MSRFKLTESLLSWYSKNARDLPWRESPNPYTVWVSEIMLQQTRVETVIPFYTRWIVRFPTIEKLASATQQEVLGIWEGQGYYSRARNLHRAAQFVVQQMGGELPSDTKTLRTLPGIGRYTAGMIVSIAFGKDEPVLDGNIRRVYSQVFNTVEPLRTSASEKKLWELAKVHLPVGRAGDYNQALMDLGAMICTTRTPACERCPIANGCQAFELGLQQELPVVKAKAAIPHYTVTAAVIKRDHQVLIAQRPSGGLLGGMWEFPGGKQLPDEDLVTCLQREIREELDARIIVGEPMGVYRHAYTHFKITLHAFRCTLHVDDTPAAIQVDDFRWVSQPELSSFPMGKLDRLIANELGTLE